MNLVKKNFKKKKLIYVDFYTNTVELIKYIQKPFIIQRLFTENKILFRNNKIFPFKIFLVKKDIDLNKYLKNNPALAISIGISIIFKKKVISKYTCGIWNIHPGDLPKYRGRHPITAAFLNNERRIGITVHSIDHKIDMGMMLAKMFVKRNLIDDDTSIKKKIFKKVPIILNKSLKNFLNKKTKKISKGKYHKPFFNGIRIANSKKFSKTYIYNAIKAQKSYGGIFINYEKFIDVKLYNKKYSSQKFYKTLYCKNSEKLLVKKIKT